MTSKGKGCLGCLTIFILLFIIGMLTGNINLVINTGNKVTVWNRDIEKIKSYYDLYKDKTIKIESHSKANLGTLKIRRDNDKSTSYVLTLKLNNNGMEYFKSFNVKPEMENIMKSDGLNNRDISTLSIIIFKGLALDHLTTIDNIEKTNNETSMGSEGITNCYGHSEINGISFKDSSTILDNKIVIHRNITSEYIFYGIHQRTDMRADSEVSMRTAKWVETSFNFSSSNSFEMPKSFRLVPK